MRLYHRHSLFPLVVVGLSLLLGGFMFWTFQDKPVVTSVIEQVTQPIDAQAYQDDLARIMKTFDERFSDAKDDPERLLATTTTLTGLLSLRVPAEFKDLHLGLAVALNQLQTTLKDGTLDVNTALESIHTLRAGYDWL